MHERFIAYALAFYLSEKRDVNCGIKAFKIDRQS